LSSKGGFAFDFDYPPLWRSPLGHLSFFSRESGSSLGDVDDGVEDDDDVGELLLWLAAVGHMRGHIGGEKAASEAEHARSEERKALAIGQARRAGRRHLRVRVRRGKESDALEKPVILLM